MRDTKEKTEITSENFRKCIINALSNNQEKIKNECEKLKNKKKSKNEIKEKLNVLNAWYEILQDSNQLKKFASALTSINTLGKFSDQACPDQYIGEENNLYAIKDFCTGSKDYKQRINAEKIQNSENTVILILESPHQNEFDKEHNPNGPAMGKTGKNIVKYFRIIFGNKFADYHLLLLNAVNFQCSLGVDTKIFRDHVFREVWDYCDTNGQYPYRKNFEDRLKVIINFSNGGNLVIINACTEGEFVEKKLWEKVEEQVDVVLDKIISSEIPYCHIGHPSCWAFPCRDKKCTGEPYKKYEKYKEMIDAIQDLRSKDSLQSGAISFNTAFKELFSGDKEE